MRTILLLILFGGSCFFVSSQYLLNVNFTSVNNYLDSPRIVETPSGDGFIMTSNQIISGSLYQRGLIMRINNLGDTLWTRHLDSLEILDIEVESVNSYLIMGNIFLGSSTWKSVAMSVDGSGNIQWSKEYHSGMGNSMSRSQTGNVYMLTNHNRLTKLNNSGDTLWVKEYMDSIVPLGPTYNYFNLYKVKSTSDGGCILSGNHENFGSPIEFIVKIDSNGDIQWTWEEGIDATGIGAYQIVESLEELNNGNFLATYVSGGYHGYMVVLDANGNYLWGKYIFGSPHIESFIAFPTNSNRIMTSMVSNLVGTEVYPYMEMIEYNSLGDTLSTHVINNMAHWSNRFALDGLERNNGDYVFVGEGLDYSTEEAVFILEMGNSGNFHCNEKTHLVTVNDISANWPYIPEFKSTSVSSFVVSNYGYQSIIDTLTLDFTCLVPQELCVVTVNQDSLKNEIIWEKAYDSTFVSHYNIYKETTVAGVYNLIGTTSINDDGYFMDYTSMPYQVAARYYVTPVQIIGVEGDPGTVHKTILLQASAGTGNDVNLSWNHYEGVTFPTYRIWRGNNTAGFSLIDSVASTLNSYTDVNPPVGDSVYYIEIMLPYSCDPSAKAPVPSSKSNQTTLLSSGLTQAKLAELIEIYPNPTNGEFKIEGLQKLQGNISIKITAIDGTIVEVHRNVANNTFELSIPGVYFVSVEQEGNIIGTYKVVKQ